MGAIAGALHIAPASSGDQTSTGVFGAITGAAGAVTSKIGEAATLGISKLLDSTLDRLRVEVKKNAVADPDMPQSVKQRVEGAIDDVWGDVSTYVKRTADESYSAYRGATESEWVKLSEIGLPCCVCGPRWIRGRVLYAYAPFDRSIFGQIRNPLFWILTILSLINYYGIRVIFFALLLLLIQAGMPADTYQLSMYIIALKGSQFISSGVAMGLKTAVGYYICVAPGGLHSCDADGPGVSWTPSHSLIDLLGSCVLAWAAFLLLPLSHVYDGSPPPSFFLPREGEEEKEQLVEGGRSEAEQAPRKATVFNQQGGEEDYARICGRRARFVPERGGRLGNLLKYDLVIFVISVFAMICLLCFDYYRWEKVGDSGAAQLTDEQAEVTGYSRGEIYNDRSFRVSLYLARLIYALLCFPFTVYLIPGLVYVLLHVNPTGYNRQGACVPFHMRTEEEVAAAEAAAAAGAGGEAAEGAGAHAAEEQKPSDEAATPQTQLLSEANKGRDAALGGAAAAGAAGAASAAAAYSAAAAHVPQAQQALAGHADAAQEAAKSLLAGITGASGSAQGAAGSAQEAATSSLGAFASQLQHGITGASGSAQGAAGSAQEAATSSLGAIASQLQHGATFDATGGERPGATTVSSLLRSFTSPPAQDAPASPPTTEPQLSPPPTDPQIHSPPGTGH